MHVVIFFSTHLVTIERCFTKFSSFTHIYLKKKYLS